MTTLLLCDYPMDAASVRRDLGIPTGCLLDSHGMEPRSCRGREPYLLGDDGMEGQAICSLLQPDAPLLTELCLGFGGPTTLAVAQLADELRGLGPDALAGLGAATGIANTRLGGLATAIEAHQRNILAYRAALKAGSSAGPARAAALQALQRSAKDLNERFALEVRTLARSLTPRFRTLLSEGKRLPDLVKQTRKVARLDISSRIQALSLTRLARGIKRLDRGLFAVDLVSRVKSTYQEYKSGGNWQRRAFTELGGLGFAFVAGDILSGASTVAMGVVAVSTRNPAAVLATGAAAVPIVMEGTQMADSLGQRFGAGVYDELFPATRPLP